jgi:hypothetical protein
MMRSIESGEGLTASINLSEGPGIDLRVDVAAVLSLLAHLLPVLRDVV